MGTSYLGGLAIYTLRIPERFFPGKFDIIVITSLLITIYSGPQPSDLAFMCLLGCSVFLLWGDGQSP